MSEPRSIVVVLAKGFPPTPGGVETYSEQVTRAYVRAGFDVTVLTQTDGPVGWSDSAIADETFRVWNVGAGGQLTVARRLLGAARRLRRESKVIGVHSTTWRVGVVAQLIFRNLPRVVTVHGREVLNFPVGTGPLLRWVLNRASRVLAVSSETMKIAREAIPEGEHAKWVVSHNGLSDADGARAFRRVPHEGRVRVLSLCRLVPRKNIALVVRAIADLTPELRDRIEVRIAGRGSEADRIAKLVAESGLGAQVMMLGYVEDEQVPALYQWADVFVHPHSHVGEGADFEGFGIVIADAMAYGCAVISGRDGGPRDFIRDHDTGLLVDGNDVDTIRSALEEMVRQDETRQLVAERGRQYALANFSWDKHVEPAIEMFN
jgi:phosphatidylinositol alpha-1,6-mannosyltransferase